MFGAPFLLRFHVKTLPMQCVIQGRSKMIPCKYACCECDTDFHLTLADCNSQKKIFNRKFANTYCLVKRLTPHLCSSCR